MESDTNIISHLSWSSVSVRIKFVWFSKKLFVRSFSQCHGTTSHHECQGLRVIITSGKRIDRGGEATHISPRGILYTLPSEVIVILFLAYLQSKANHCHRDEQVSNGTDVINSSTRDTRGKARFTTNNPNNSKTGMGWGEAGLQSRAVTFLALTA